MDNRPTPRVNSANMPKYLGQVVRLTAKVLKISGDTAVVEASDGGQVEVRLSRDSHMTDLYVEIIGQVEDEGTLKMLSSMNMGSELDMQVIDDMVVAIHKFPNNYM